MVRPGFRATALRDRLLLPALDHAPAQIDGSIFAYRAYASTLLLRVY